MTAREVTLEPVVASRRLAATKREQAAYEAFCSRHEIPISPESVTLYLTDLLHSGTVQGRGLRYRLHLLDLHARLAGTPPPSTDVGLRRYLRGLHRQAALTGPEQIVEPLHREALHAVLDMIDRPLPAQVRDRALLLLAAASSLPAQVLADMQWSHLRLGDGWVEVTVPPMPGRGPRSYSPLRITDRRGYPSTTEALLAWRQQARPGGGPAWAWERAQYDIGTMRPVLHRLGPRPSPTDIGSWRCTPAIVRGLERELLSPQPRAVRDRALLLLAWTAALGTDEAVGIRQADVRVVERGLLLRVAGRREPTTALPRRGGNGPCPVEAWEQWHRTLTRRDLDDPDAPAFLQVMGTSIWRSGMQREGLNALLNQRVEAAGLRGQYGFTSLRIGFIRTAARAGAPEHVIARQAGLVATRSVAEHARRETVLSKNVAALVGL